MLYRIAMTGGPCAGKSSSIAHIIQELSDFGCHVIYMAEAARELMAANLSPSTLGVRKFQEMLFSYILKKEDAYLEMADRVDHEGPVVILFDRGIMDNRAYMTNDEFMVMLGRRELRIVDMRDRRYDAVLHFRSVAVDLPELYVTDNERRETVLEARALDEKTCAAWQGHPHLRVLDNSTDLRGKAARAVREICQLIGIPEPLEIERKYLVRIPDGIPVASQTVEIEQWYLASPGEGEERIRRRGQEGGYLYFHATKVDRPDGARVEREHMITRDEYAELMKRRDPRRGPIRKLRTCFVFQNQYFELDIFGSADTIGPDRALLEIELTTLQQEVVLPPFIEIDREVTDDPHYRNSQLALYTLD